MPDIRIDTPAVLPEIWPLPAASPELELALDAVTHHQGIDGRRFPRMFRADIDNRPGSILMLALDMLDGLYGRYHEDSRIHICVPRAEPEYRDHSLLDLIKAGRHKEAYDLIEEDVLIENRIEHLNSHSNCNI